MAQSKAYSRLQATTSHKAMERHQTATMARERLVGQAARQAWAERQERMDRAEAEVERLFSEPRQVSDAEIERVFNAQAKANFERGISRP